MKFVTEVHKDLPQRIQKNTNCDNKIDYYLISKLLPLIIIKCKKPI